MKNDQLLQRALTALEELTANDYRFSVLKQEIRSYLAEAQEVDDLWEPDYD